MIIKIELIIQYATNLKNKLINVFKKKKEKNW